MILTTYTKLIIKQSFWVLIRPNKGPSCVHMLVDLLVLYLLLSEVSAKFVLTFSWNNCQGWQIGPNLDQIRTAWEKSWIFSEYNLIKLFLKVSDLSHLVLTWSNYWPIGHPCNCLVSEITWTGSGMTSLEWQFPDIVLQGSHIYHPNWVRLAQNGTNLGLFLWDFSTFRLGESKWRERALKISHLSHIVTLWSVWRPNLTSLSERVHKHIQGYQIWHPNWIT